MIDVAKYEARLRKRLSELTDRVVGVEHALDAPAPKDSEERATEREGDEVLESLGNQGMLEIRMIEAALKRVEEGTFGECVNCGEEIAEARLDAVPHAPRCVKCA